MSPETKAPLAPILVVDDEPDNLDALRRLLRSEFVVTAVSSPVDALKALQKEKFQVVVCDQRMPEMTGVELLEKAKQLQPNATRILLTGYTDIESVIGAINRGQVWRYVAKPWDPEELKAILRQATESFRLRTELEEKNRALAAAVEELRGLDRAKARFLSLVTHELNTPITVLGAFLDLLLESKDTFEPEIRKSLESLASAKSRLAEIVADTLYFTRLELEGTQLDDEKDLRKVLDSALKALAPTFTAKKVKVESPAGEKTPSVQGAHLAEESLRRLFGEIAQRAKGGTTVAVHATASGEVSVEWQGEKIPEAAFEAFETGGELLHHSRNLGLGLAIVRRIFDKLSVLATWKAVASGGTLSLRFPIGRA